MENPVCKHLSVQQLFSVPKILPVITHNSSSAPTSPTATMVMASQPSSGHLSPISKKSKVSVQKIVVVLVICLAVAHVYNEINIRKKAREENKPFNEQSELPFN